MFVQSGFRAEVQLGTRLRVDWSSPFPIRNTRRFMAQPMASLQAIVPIAGGRWSAEAHSFAIYDSEQSTVAGVAARAVVGDSTMERCTAS